MCDLQGQQDTGSGSGPGFICSGTAQASGDLHLLQADWTRPDPAIAAFLAFHGRFDIPFNMIVTVRLETLIILPELLTSSIVIEALEKAGIAAK